MDTRPEYKLCKDLCLEYGAEGLAFDRLYKETLQPLMLNPQAFKLDKQKMHIACIMIGKKMLQHIQTCFPYAHFTEKEHLDIAQHLGYVSQRIGLSACEIITNNIDLSKLRINDILSVIQNCPLKTQKNIMKQVLRTKPNMLKATKHSDVSFEFKNNEN